MGKGRTGYEILKQLWAGKPKSVESQFFNPLEAKVGSLARISERTVTTEALLGDADQLWTVGEIWAWERSINGNIHNMADYVLVSDSHRLVLRVIPNIVRGKQAEPTTLLLAQYWPDNQVGPHAWDDESNFILDGLMDKTGEFVRFKGEPTEERYFRDLSNIKSDVAILADTNQDGALELEEVNRQPYSLWTFRRTTTDTISEFEQHIHVQLSGHYNHDTKKIAGGDKDILMLRGEIVMPQNIMMY